MAARRHRSPRSRPAGLRLPIVDALRGFAILQMIGFHGVYVMRQLGYVQIDQNAEPPWIAWRVAIVSQFLLIAGLGLALRAEYKPSWPAFWRRWREVAAAAAVVTFGSALVLGPRAIWFGILHLVAVGLIGARLLLPLGLANLGLGLLVVMLGVGFAHPVFDTWPETALGFVTRAPLTEDYVPLFPWFGVVLIGTGLGVAWQRRGFRIAGLLARLNASPPRLLIFLGSWPLTVYLAHVPLLAGLVMTLGWAATQLGLRG